MTDLANDLGSGHLIMCLIKKLNLLVKSATLLFFKIQESNSTLLTPSFSQIKVTIKCQIRKMKTSLFTQLDKQEVNTSHSI